jgi:hypothetical protein
LIFATCVAAFGDDVGGAEFQGELLPRVVPAHGGDALGTELLGREHTQQPDRSVTDNGDRLALSGPGGLGREPSGAHVSEAVSRLGIRSSSGMPGVATRVPSASGMRNRSACAPLALTHSRCTQEVW